MSPSVIPKQTGNNSTTASVDTSHPQENHGGLYPSLPSTSSNNANATIVAAPSNTFHVFSLALLNRGKQRDHIRFHQLPDALEPTMTSLISDWGGRKHYSISSLTSIEYQLPYDAWSEFRPDTNAIWARSLLIEIMSRLALHGWNFSLGMEVTKTKKGKDILFFETGVSDPGVNIFCINFPKGDRIKVINAAPEIINGIGQVIKATWYEGLQEGAPGAYKSFEFKVGGIPWWHGSFPRERERKCKLMACIFQFLRGQGYKSYASVKITQKDEEMPTLFFRKITNVFK